MSNKRNVFDGRELLKIRVAFRHSAIEATLLNVKFFHQLPILSTLLAFPNLLKALRVDISNAESLIK